MRIRRFQVPPFIISTTFWLISGILTGVSLVPKSDMKAPCVEDQLRSPYGYACSDNDQEYTFYGEYKFQLGFL